MDLDSNRRIFEIHFVSSTILSPDNYVGQCVAPSCGMQIADFSCSPAQAANNITDQASSSYCQRKPPGIAAAVRLQPSLRAEGSKINARRRVPTTCGIASAEPLRDLLVAVGNPQRGVFRSWFL